MKSRRIITAICAVVLMAAVTTIPVYAEVDVPNDETINAIASEDESAEPLVGEVGATVDADLVDVFPAGTVWAATVDDSDSITYYCFEDETSGYTVDSEMGIGVAFMYEAIDANTYMFHLAAADDNTEVAITDVGSGGIVRATIFGKNTLLVYQEGANAETFGDEYRAALNQTVASDVTEPAEEVTGKIDGKGSPATGIVDTAVVAAGIALLAGGACIVAGRKRK